MSADDGAKPGPSSAITQKKEKQPVPDEEIGSMRHMAADPGHCINYNLAPDEFVVQCPYEKSHFFRPSRAEPHLYRCRNNYAKARAKKGLPEEPRITCQYCPFHRIRAKEVEFHEAQCYYKHVPFDEILKAATKVDPDREKKEKEKGFDPNAWMNDPEYIDWCPTPGIIPYDPLNSEAYRQALHHPIPTRMSKADKKKWWTSERDRINRILAGPPFQDSYQQPFLGPEEPPAVSEPQKDGEGNLILVKFEPSEKAKKKMLAASAFEGPEPFRTLFYSAPEDPVGADGSEQPSGSKSKTSTETAPKETPTDEAQPVVALQPIASGSQTNSSLVPIEGMATVEAAEESGDDPTTGPEDIDDVIQDMEENVKGLELGTSSKTSKLGRGSIGNSNDPKKKKPSVATKGLNVRARPLIKSSRDSGGAKKRPREQAPVLPVVGASPFSLNRMKEPPKSK